MSTPFLKKNKKDFARGRPEKATHLGGSLPSRFSAPTDPLWGLADQTLVRCGSDQSPPTWGSAAHLSLAGGYQSHCLSLYRPCEPSRPAHFGNRVPWGSPSFDGLIISRSVQIVKGFLRIFYEILNSLLGSNARWKACTSPLWRPLARLSAGVPRRGWGPHPLLTLTLYHPYSGSAIANVGKFLTNFYILAGRPVLVAPEHPTKSSND